MKLVLVYLWYLCCLSAASLSHNHTATVSSELSQECPSGRVDGQGASLDLQLLVSGHIKLVAAESIIIVIK